MTLLVLLVSADHNDVSLGSKNVEALALLGVTSVSVARDEHTAAVVLEGWALDPAQHDTARAALGASAENTRALQPIVQMAVSAGINKEVDRP